ncbi:MAG: MMPL family transporter [Planctomycetota bacterium]
MSERITSFIAHWLVDWRWVLLGLGAALAVASYFPASRLDFDRSVENMFAPDDPLLVPYAQLKRTFGGDDVAVASYDDPDLMTPIGMARVAALSEQLAAVGGVQSVVGLMSTPLGAEIIEDEGRGPAYLKLLEGYNVSADHKTTAIACLLDPSAASEVREATVHRLQEVVKAFSNEAVLVGGPVMVVEGFRLVEHDGKQLGWLSTILLMAAIVICFRSLRWVVIPILIVNATLFITKGALEVSGLRLSMISSMLWAIVTVQGVATVIHLVVAFRESRSTGTTPREALLASCKLLAVPILWTCLTDAAGFGSLLAAQVGPVRDFGLMMVVGSLVSIVPLAMLLPGLTLAGGKYVDPKWAWGEAGLSAALRRLMDGVLRWPKTIGALAVVMTVAAGLGCYRLEVESDFTKNFRESSELVTSYNFVEQRLGGVGVWDVIVPAPPPEDMSERYLSVLRHLENRLRTEVTVADESGRQTPALTKVMSLVDGLDTVPTGRLLARDVLVRIKHRKLQEQMPDIARAVYGEDPHQPGKYFARIMLRAKERQSSQQKQLLIAQVTEISREVFPGNEQVARAEVTGFFVLLTNLIHSMLRDQWTTFGIAVTAIGMMMLVAFRSPVLAIVALVPNVLPILILTGLMGWLGFKINMGAAMIAAVSMGLSVDSGIHYLSMFCRLRKQGQSVDGALHAVQQSVGRAVFFSTLALVIGFGTLCLSDFVPTIYFGALVSLSFVGGLLGNLVILPLLLRLVVSDKPR